MDRKEFISLLRQMGTNDKLLEMPGIIEPIFSKLKNKTEREIRNTKALLVLKSGNISFGDIDCFVSGDGEKAKIVKGDKEIEVNKDGIQTSLNMGSGPSFYSYMNRKNGIIECVSQNHNTFSRKCFLDNGNCLIEEACGERVNASLFGKSEKNGEDIDRVKLDKKAIVTSFKRNAGKIIREYPKTYNFYSKLQKQLIYNINLQNDPVKKMQRTIDRLKAENDELRNRNESLMKRLHAATKFIEGVKKSPAGRFLLKRHWEGLDSTDPLNR